MNVRICIFLLIQLVFGKAYLVQAKVSDSLLFVLKTELKEDTNRVNLLNQLSGQYIYDNIDSAILLARESIALAKKTGFRFGEGKAFRKLGFAYKYQGDPTRAIAAYDSAMVIMKGLKNVPQEAAILFDIATVYQATGKLEEATPLFIRACLTFKKVRDWQSLAGSLNSLGMNYTYMDQYDKGLECLLLTLKIFQKQKNQFGKAIVLTNLANLYEKIGKFEHAEQSALFAREIFIHEGNTHAEATTEGILGNIYQMQGKYEDAFLHYQKSLQLAEMVGDKYGIAKRLTNLGSTYFQSGDYSAALVNYYKALELSAYINSTREYAEGMNNMALLYLEMDKPDSTIYFGHKGLVILENLGSPKSLKNTYNVLSKAYAAKHNYDSAYYFLNKETILKDSIFDIEKVNAVEEVQAKYETEMRQAEITKLRFQNELSQNESQKNRLIMWAVIGVAILTFISIAFGIYALRTKSKQKQTELEQKALRAQMNPHFIFNSLNSIQRMYIEGETDRAGDFTADFAELMRKTLDNNDKSKISLEEELKTLQLYLRLEKLRCKDQFEYEITASVDLCSIQVPPLIFQPFVENAIWHGILPGQKKGKIRIIVTAEKDKIRCIVSDNGVGIDHLKTKLHKSKGISITEQRIGNKIQLESSKETGTTVTFYLPF